MSDVLESFFISLLTVSTFTTFSYVVLVSFFAIFFASLVAYINSRHDFFGKNFYSLLHIIPLIYPPYILAFLFVDIANNIVFNSLILSISVFPYAYMILFIAFQKIGFNGKILRQFYNIKQYVIIKEAFLKQLYKPLVFCFVLISLEIISEFGAFAIYGDQTYALHILNYFQLMNDPIGVAILSIFPLVIGIVLCSFLVHNNTNINVKKSFVVRNSIFFHIINLAILCFTIVLPFSILVYFMINIHWPWVNLDFLFDISMNSIILTFMSVISIIFITYLLKDVRYINKVFLVLYGMPSFVLAIFALYIFGFVNALWIIILIYIIRYGSVSLNFIRMSYQQNEKYFHIYNNFFNVNHWKLYIPFLYNILFIFSFLWIDIFKELSIVYILKPFSYDTLATFIFEHFRHEMVYEVSIFIFVMLVINMIILGWVSKRFMYVRSKIY